VKFYKYKFPILFCRGVVKATLITFCFILTYSLQINKLKFITVLDTLSEVTDGGQRGELPPPLAS